MPKKKQKKNLPTETGLILIPSSLCASSGLSDSFFARTLSSQRVLTKVVRPVPEAPIFFNKNFVSHHLAIIIFFFFLRVHHTNYHQGELKTFLYVLSASSKSLYTYLYIVLDSYIILLLQLCPYVCHCIILVVIIK